MRGSAATPDDKPTPPHWLYAGCIGLAIIVAGLLVGGAILYASWRAEQNSFRGVIDEAGKAMQKAADEMNRKLDEEDKAKKRKP